MELQPSKQDEPAAGLVSVVIPGLTAGPRPPAGMNDGSAKGVGTAAERWRERSASERVVRSFMMD